MSKLDVQSAPVNVAPVGVPLLPRHMVRAATLAAVGTRLHVTNWRGDPWPGAKLWPVEPGTATPKVAFADDDCTMPHGAFVVADADGFFPLLHAASGELYDLILTTPEGVQLLRYEPAEAS